MLSLFGPYISYRLAFVLEEEEAASFLVVVEVDDKGTGTSLVASIT